MVTRAACVALLGAALTGAASAQASDDAPLCRVSVKLERGETSAGTVVGQQVVYRLRIVESERVTALHWERPLAFPAFRTEWLPGAVLGVAPPGTRLREERRALFPARAGSLDIPEAALRCLSGTREEVAEIPALRLDVVEPPRAGQPAGFSGVVGPVEVSSSLSAASLLLGESVRLAVVIQGEGNLWDLPDLLPAGVEGADLFRRPPEIARDAGRRLGLRRYVAYDLVPRRPGPLRIPALRIDYFDAGTGRYAAAHLPESVVEVAGAASPARGESPATAAAGSPSPPVAAESAPRAPDARLRLAVLCALAALSLAAVSLALAARRRAPPRSPSPVRAVESALAAARSAEATGRREEAAEALARALRLALCARREDARALSSEEILARAGDEAERAAARLLARLDHARFGGGEPPSAAEVVTTLASLGS